MKTSLALLLALSSLGIHSVASARPGDLCTKTQSTFAGGGTYYGFFHVDLNWGNDADVSGSQCVTLPDGSDNCFAVDGAMVSHNGFIEITTTASDELTLAPYGKMNAFAIRFWKINPETMTGTATLVSSQIVAGKINQVSDTATVNVIACPKWTEEDRENQRILRKFTRDAARLR